MKATYPICDYYGDYEAIADAISEHAWGHRWDEFDSAIINWVAKRFDFCRDIRITGNKFRVTTHAWLHMQFGAYDINGLLFFSLSAKCTYGVATPTEVAVKTMTAIPLTTFIYECDCACIDIYNALSLPAHEGRLLEEGSGAAKTTLVIHPHVQGGQHRGHRHLPYPKPPGRITAGEARTLEFLSTPAYMRGAWGKEAFVMTDLRALSETLGLDYKLNNLKFRRKTATEALRKTYFA